LSPSSSLLLLAKTITHPAARSLCNSWASYYKNHMKDCQTDPVWATPIFNRYNMYRMQYNKSLFHRFYFIFIFFYKNTEQSSRFGCNVHSCQNQDCERNDGDRMLREMSRSWRGACVDSRLYNQSSRLVTAGCWRLLVRPPDVGKASSFAHELPFLFLLPRCM